MAEYEAELIKERTAEALSSKRKRGIKGGRKRIPESKLKIAFELYDLNRMEVKEICANQKISKVSFYKYLRIRNATVEDKKVKENQ
jgi:DNA invertase Pin-like site-specific DNA recombinase